MGSTVSARQCSYLDGRGEQIEAKPVGREEEGARALGWADGLDGNKQRAKGIVLEHRRGELARVVVVSGLWQPAAFFGLRTSGSRKSAVVH